MAPRQPDQGVWRKLDIAGEDLRKFSELLKGEGYGAIGTVLRPIIFSRLPPLVVIPETFSSTLFYFKKF